MGLERNPMMAPLREPADEKGSAPAEYIPPEAALQMNTPDLFSVPRLMQAGLRQKSAKRLANILRRDFDGKTVRQFMYEHPTAFALSQIPGVGENMLAAIVNISTTYGLPLDTSQYVPPEKAVPLPRMRVQPLDKPVTVNDWDSILKIRLPQMYRLFLEKIRAAGEGGIRVRDVGTDDQPFQVGHLDAINEILKGHGFLFRIVRKGMVIGSYWPERTVHMSHVEPIGSKQNQ